MNQSITPEEFKAEIDNKADHVFIGAFNVDVGPLIVSAGLLVLSKKIVDLEMIELFKERSGDSPNTL